MKKRFTKAIALIAVLIPLCAYALSGFALGATWSGVDETVVERYAEEAGHSARPPLINTDQGDLLLFVFLMAGAIGGFIAGYYWRILFKEKGRIQRERVPSEDARIESRDGATTTATGE